MSVKVEICVDSIASALAAARGGAHRLELCSALSEGGLTPSAGMIATVRKLVPTALYVMVRPRAGDFCYSAEEFECMKRDVAMAKQLGAGGIVFGILTPGKEIDQSRCRELLELARPLKATLHRAFDVTNNKSRALEDAISLGFERILTSGGADKVARASDVVAKLREQAGERVALMIGSGVNSINVRELLASTGVSEVHASARSPRETATRSAIPEFDLPPDITDENEVRKLVQIAAAFR